jgi:gamma-glutamylcyclotransferase (GGCT)/AIG2-like uncharacterized protein YtfP
VALYSDGRVPFVAPGNANDCTHGVLITVDPDQYAETLARLDALERYTPGGLANWYTREIRVVTTVDGPSDAYVYLAGPRIAARIRVGRLRRVPDGIWYD